MSNSVVASKRCAFELILLLISLSSASLGQSKFSGKWETRTNAARGSSITLNITADGDSVGGTVILRDLHSRIEMEIVNPRVKGEILEFETKQEGEAWHWRLAVEGKKNGQLHGSIGEMLIDERVRKRSDP